MKKVIRLNERDLTRIIKRVINEEIKTIDPIEDIIPPSPYVDPKEIVDKLKQLLDSMRDDDVLDKTDEDLFKDLFNAFKVQKKGEIYDSETLTFYTIKSGDTLSKIANSFGTTVNRIMELNPKITDPNKINVGQQIKIEN